MLLNGEGRPQLAQPGSGPNADRVTNSTVTLADLRNMPQASGPRRVTVVTLPPCGRRSWFAASWPCPWCSGFHLSRARTEAELLGPRRAGCGRLVVLTAAAGA
jgi:hypothetical protein